MFVEVIVDWEMHKWDVFKCLQLKCTVIDSKSLNKQLNSIRKHVKHTVNLVPNIKLKPKDGIVLTRPNRIQLGFGKYSPVL